MKVAIVTPFYRPSLGGMQESLGVFADYLVAQGCTVKVYASQRQRMDELPIVSFKGVRRRFPLRRMEGGAEVFRFPCGGLLDGLLGLMYAVSFKLFRPSSPFFYTLYQRRLIRERRLAREVIRFRPDAILAGPCVEYLMRLSVRLAAQTGARLVVKSVIHLSDGEGEDQSRGAAYLTKADAVLANSEKEKEYLLSRGVEASKVGWPSVPLDLKGWGEVREADADKSVVERLSGREYVLYFGRKQAKKGIEELIEAFRHLRGARPQTILVLAGEETDHFSKKVAPGLPAEEGIVSLGRQSEATKRWLFSHAKVFVMVSRVDSFGIVYCESWFSKRPVIGADNGQMRGVIRDGQDGFLVPAEDPRALEAKLRVLLEDAALADSMGRSGYERLMKEFGGQAVEKKLFKLLCG